ncbi:MAG: hypothetical protein K6G39_00790 [Bacteroidales bacterium]|nr:hypothetical protein [Bacteroidales bacterium]
MDTNKYIQLADLDWGFNQDAQNIYRYFADRKTHGLEEKDRVVLTAECKDVSQLGEVLKVEEDGLLIHTDEWLDISEAYSIEAIKI